MAKFGMWAAAAAAALLTGAASAPPPGAQGYLGAAGPDTIRILPPSPEPGSPRDQADRAIFRAGRTAKDTPRWSLAQNDLDETRILEDLSCAVGAPLTPARAPKTAALLKNLRFDVGRAVNRPKDFYKRPRPYLVQDGPICVDKSAGLAANPDYPSGHVTWSWTVGLIVAELASDRATDVLVRARAFGESRMVCGVHSLSAVEAGRTNASALVAALHGSSRFRADLDAARAELAQLRKAGPAADPAVCAKEAALTATTPY